MERPENLRNAGSLEGAGNLRRETHLQEAAPRFLFFFQNCTAAGEYRCKKKEGENIIRLVSDASLEIVKLLWHMEWADDYKQILNDS